MTAPEPAPESADEPRRAARRAPRSLRLRLLLMLLSATCLVWLAAAAWGYQDARHEAEELLDAQLAQSVRLLTSLVRHELREEAGHLSTLEIFDGEDLHPYEQALRFLVLDREGRTLLGSAAPPPLAPAQASGYADVHADGKGWRLLVVDLPAEGLRIEVAQSLAIRDELASYIALRLALPLALALPLLGLLIVWLLGRGLKPLRRLAANVAARTPENLAPVRTEDLPTEARPLGLALNRLLDRLNRALASERRFTADAAHELRTPLAAIQVHAQVALSDADEPVRRHAVAQVLAGTRRAAHLVDELLRLARLDPLARLPEPRPVALAEVVRRVVEERSAHADRLNVDLGTAADARVDGDPELLYLALRNLADNALRYSAPGSEVTLRLTRDDGGLVLAVADRGPGVGADELPRLTERFYRGREVTAEGSGLGLGIVQRVAELHDARLTLANRPGGGLEASLRWPPPGAGGSAAAGSAGSARSNKASSTPPRR